MMRTQLEKQAHSFWPYAQGLLRKASHSLFHPEPDVDVASLSSLPINLKVVALEESEVAALQMVKGNEQESSSEGKPSFLVRIESSTERSTSLSRPPNNFYLFDMDSSIILFNFGTAFECLSLVSNGLQEFHKSALSLSVLSYSIFHENFWALQPIQDSGVWAEYLPLLIIFLQNLVKLSSRSGKASDAEEFHLKLVEVSEIFLERHLNLAGIIRGWSTAAAD